MDSSHGARLSATVSIVIPLHNEQFNISPLLLRIREAIIGPQLFEAVEVIVVDDGSTDGTASVLSDLRLPWVRAIHRRTKGGITAALRSGIEQARFRYIVTIDGDLQNHPEDIPLLMNKILEGYDCAGGVRIKRNDGVVKVFSSVIGNFVRRQILKDPFADGGCGLRAFPNKSIQDLLPFEGAHRFFPVLATHLGWRFAEVPIRHSPRSSGYSKYGIRNRVLKGLKDAIHVRRLMRTRYE